jgi:hypothetical protein
MIISRINGFTYVQTSFDYYTGQLTIVSENPILRASGKSALFRSDDVREALPLCITRE